MMFEVAPKSDTAASLQADNKTKGTTLSDLEVKTLQEAVSVFSPIVKRLGNSKACLTQVAEGHRGIGSRLEQVTWTEFAERVEALAGHIQAFPHGRVAIGIRRSCSLIVAQAAAHLAGRTFVPLDPSWPRNRINKILSATECTVLIQDARGMVDSTGPYTPSTVTPTLTMDRLGVVASSRAADRTSKHEFSRTPPPEVMYVMFTSGSTGEPKGVEVYTKGVYHYLSWKAPLLNLTENDVFIHKTPCTFDVSIGELWLPLALGATSHVLGDGLHLDAGALYEELELGNVSVCNFVPSLLLLFLADVASLPKKASLPKLEKILCTGEAVKMEHKKKLTEVLGPEVQLINMYGPTEATVEVTYYICEDVGEQELSSHGYPIGWVPPGVGVHIVDVNDPKKLVDSGQKGEICLSGVQVAKGYLHRDDLTNERFITCPWDKTGHGKMYRTGDLGRHNPETGYYEYNGRVDRQVKVGGVRIELGEIEAVTMRLFDHLFESTTIVLIDGQLVGVVVPKKNDDERAEGTGTFVDPSSILPPQKEMSDAILSILPKAYNPSEWYAIDADDLPLNTAGKIDVNAVEEWVRHQRTINVWAEVYDQLYDDSTVLEAGRDPTMDWASYKDSFDPAHHHKESVITEWVMETVEWALSHARESAGSEKDATILEMGCGKGMILLKMAPRVKVAVGADISRHALNHVQGIWKGYMKKNNLHGVNQAFLLAKCDAAAFEKLPASVSSFNTILCNGVSMYLPSFGYVLDYLNGATDRVEEDRHGAVLLGDVRSLHHSELFQLRRLLCIGKSAKEARETAEASARDDKDRTYDHRAFHALGFSNMLRSRVAAVEVQLKEGKEDSEFTGYRYDVALYCMPKPDTEDEKKSEDMDRTIMKVKTAMNFSKLIDERGIESITIQNVLSLLRECLQSERIAHREQVYACLNIPNQRVYSDYLVASCQSDSSELACPTYGVKPASLRTELKRSFPDKHVVLTWSRDINDNTKFTKRSLACMDVYLVPNQSFSSKISGLEAVSRHCLKGHENMVSELTKNHSLLEKYISQINAQATSSSDGGSKKGSMSLASAAQTASEFFHQGDFSRSVRILVSSALGLPLEQLNDTIDNQETKDEITFAELGGNSFIAMKLVGAMRANFGAAPAVFKLLTEPLSTFVQEAVEVVKKSRQSSDADWMVHVELPGTNGLLSEDAPCVVLFPTAGGSPKVFANTFRALRSLMTSTSAVGCHVFMGQAPGRDARAHEPNLTDFTKLVEHYTNALISPLGLLGNQSNKGMAKQHRRVVMCGDSLGAITCWSVAHELRKRSGFLPDHMFVSGNASPIVSSEQFGLGTYATKSIHECTDDDLVSFLSKGHSGFDMSDEKEIVQALRCDCVMYEDFKRDPELPKLATSATLCRGEDDPLCGSADMSGWRDEFEGAFSEVILPKAGHHIYAECGPAMAEIIAKELGQ